MKLSGQVWRRRLRGLGSRSFVSLVHVVLQICPIHLRRARITSVDEFLNVHVAVVVEVAAGIGGIIRMNTDGSGREVFTRGVRNSVGHDFNPANGDLWFTDNQVDGMGDDIPPGELNRQTSAGQHFGFPWLGGASVEIPEYRNVPRPEGVEFVAPQVEMVAHAADLGMLFYKGSSFPERYRGGIFSVQHGSWTRTTPVGARVMFTALDEEGNAAETEVFADGWLDEATGEYRGRPMDVAFLPDGSMLVSDDFAGAIWRIAYTGAQ